MHERALIMSRPANVLDKEKVPDSVVKLSPEMFASYRISGLVRGDTLYFLLWCPDVILSFD